MGKIRQTNTITDTLDGVDYNVSGTSTRTVSGYRVDSYELTTAYTEVQYIADLERQSILIYNDGANEVFVRVEEVSGGASYNYCIIPPGAPMEFHCGAESPGMITGILRIDVKAQTGTSRVIVHQVWY